MRAKTLPIVRDPADPVAYEPAVGRAVEQLREALVTRGVSARGLERLDADGESSTVIDEPCILVAGHQSAAAVSVRTPLVEQPANVVCSVVRLFTSEISDKPWCDDPHDLQRMSGASG